MEHPKQNLVIVLGGVAAIVAALVVVQLLPSGPRLRGETPEAVPATQASSPGDPKPDLAPADATQIVRTTGRALVGRLVGEDDTFQIDGMMVSVRFDETAQFEVRAERDGRFRVEVPTDRKEVTVAVHNVRGPDVLRRCALAAGADALTDLGTLSLVRSRVNLRVAVSDAWRQRQGPWPLAITARLQTGASDSDREILKLRFAEPPAESLPQTVYVDSRDPIRVTWGVRASGQIMPFSTDSQVRSMDEDGSFGEALLELDPEMFAIGRLVDGDAKPVVGATLAIASLTDGDRPLYSAKIRTVEDGRFLLPCRRGGHGYVSLDNARAKERPVAWVAGTEIVLIFEPRDGVRLRVVDAAGRPIERYGFVQRVPGGDEQGRRGLVDLLVRDCPGGSSVVKRERLSAGEVWHVVTGDGTVYAHRITRDTTTEEYSLALGTPLAVGSLEVRLGQNLLKVPALPVSLGPSVVDGTNFRSVELSASDDPGRVVRSSRIKEGSTQFLFNDLPVGSYKCAFAMGKTVVWEQWVAVVSGERAVAVLGDLTGDGKK